MVLHGGCATWRLWEPTLPLLERRFDVLAPTLPGHWGGPAVRRDAAIDVRAFADSIEQQMDAAGWSTAHVAGGSLGGWLALELARRGRARSVTAIAPACGWPPGGVFVRLLSSGYRLMMLLAPVIAGRAELWVARPRLRRILTWHHFHKPVPAHLAAHLIRAMAGADPATTKAFLAATRDYDAASELHGISCPVLIAYPEHDFVLPRRLCSRGLAEALPDADMVVLPGVGHGAMVDDPQLVANLVADFATREITKPRDLDAQTPHPHS